MYSAVTRAIRVDVEPIYLEEQSEPANGQFVWAYRVQIGNEGAETVQLLSRYWHITDGLGRIQEVRGAGVVGEQPILNPGEAYEYTSGTPLPTPSGIMRGTYKMKTPAGDKFDIEIPAFSLDSPHQPQKLN
ncbi:MAG: Co2+/Mg2+ efflux protein ApaG [Pseudomonadota bacterium]|nr:Co2+/Mg2+ efflux protein ApaG [Pseudomonadota bacterium]MEC7944077.1 Co2+/Mg2+ efflux protein ApaG [Pseudomonadota bacterium]MEC8086293.1 Co2+/Mg2+ efflux protein ApaG [Pseudomonadota bacterium]MEC8288483.1 Co2+/Mg2+ efflux protein ApaG [Pseudomonadota bacterium]MEC8531881.1 Co2+/Mg2+ efflux protein ApaG [Pseudomonadota bacterium]